MGLANTKTILRALAAMIVGISTVLATAFFLSACSSAPPPSFRPTPANPTQRTVSVTVDCGTAISSTIAVTVTLGSEEDAATVEEVLEIYHDLTEANVEAVNSASRTMDVVLGISAFIGLLVTIVAGVVGYFGVKQSLNVREALERAKSTEEIAKSTRKEIELLDAVKKRLQEEIKTLEGQISGDAQVLERLHALGEVDRYAMSLFSEDTGRRGAARKGLVHLSFHKDPVVRRQCLRVFAEMRKFLEDVEEGWYSESIARRIQEMSEQDEERGVRKEAAVVMGIWADQRREDQAKSNEPAATPEHNSD